MKEKLKIFNLAWELILIGLMSTLLTSCNEYIGGKLKPLILEDSEESSVEPTQESADDPADEESGTSTEVPAEVPVESSPEASPSSGGSSGPSPVTNYSLTSSDILSLSLADPGDFPAEEGFVKLVLDNQVSSTEEECDSIFSRYEIYVEDDQGALSYKGYHQFIPSSEEHDIHLKSPTSLFSDSSMLYCGTGRFIYKIPIGDSSVRVHGCVMHQDRSLGACALYSLDGSSSSVPTPGPGDGGDGGDGGGGASDNAAPFVSAGSDQRHTLGESFSFNASASDDGNPDNNLEITWALISGPQGGASIASIHDLKSAVTFSQLGTYAFSLTVSDGELSSSDQVSIIVQEESASSGGSSECLVGPALADNFGPASMDSFSEITCLEIRNDTDVLREGEVAYSGVPLPESLGLRNLSNLAVVGPNNVYVPAQFKVLSRWRSVVDNASAPIQWVQVSLQASVDPHSVSKYSLRNYNSKPVFQNVQKLSIVQNGTKYLIDSGVGQFTVDSASKAFISRIDALNAGGSLINIFAESSSQAAGPSLTLANGTVLDSTGAEAISLDEGAFEVVESGPVRAVFKQRGHFISAESKCSDSFNGPVVQYEGLGFTVTGTFVRGSRSVELHFNFRNECGSDDNSSGFTNQYLSVNEVAWKMPLNLEATSKLYTGNGAIQSGAFSNIELAQERGKGSPWSRGGRILGDGTVLESAVTFDSPYLGHKSSQFNISMQMPFMRFREPQGFSIHGDSMALEFISEPIGVGEARGIWNQAKIDITLPSESLETRRERSLKELERGLLVHVPLAYMNSTEVFSSLGSEAGESLVKTEYLSMLTQLLDDTINYQWARMKVYGSQVWPDTPIAPEDVSDPDHYEPNMNYWNPLGASLFEFFRSGYPRWAWDMGIPAARLQMYSAYYNTGSYEGTNRNGFAVTSGGGNTGSIDRGAWNRSGGGSDDYSYNRGMHLAYLTRPNVMMRDRFSQAGTTVVNRYSVPKEQETSRGKWGSARDIERGTVQHYEMLMNCAQFVPGEKGAACKSRLDEIVKELAEDNLRAGTICKTDQSAAQQRAQELNRGIGSFYDDTDIYFRERLEGGALGSQKIVFFRDGSSRANSDGFERCVSPQQFMINAMIYAFFVRYSRNFDDPSEEKSLKNSLVDYAKNLYTYGMDKKANGVDIDSSGPIVARLVCTLTSDRKSIINCVQAGDDGNQPNVFGPNRAHTYAILLMGHQLDPQRAQLCEITKRALNNRNLFDVGSIDYRVGMRAWISEGEHLGFYKSANQIMQHLVYAVGGVDTCED